MRAKFSGIVSYVMYAIQFNNIFHAPLEHSRLRNIQQGKYSPLVEGAHIKDTAG